MGGSLLFILNCFSSPTESISFQEHTQLSVDLCDLGFLGTKPPVTIGTSEVKGKFKVIQFFTRPYLYFDTASFIRLRIVHRILSELEPISFYRMGKILRI
jgi:hypothetical protein